MPNAPNVPIKGETRWESRIESRPPRASETPRTTGNAEEDERTEEGEERRESYNKESGTSMQMDNYVHARDDRRQAVGNSQALNIDTSHAGRSARAACVYARVHLAFRGSRGH